MYIKCEEGLGLGRTEEVNVALLTKLDQITDPDNNWLKCIC